MTMSMRVAVIHARWSTSTGSWGQGSWFAGSWVNYGPYLSNMTLSHEFSRMTESSHWVSEERIWGRFS